MTKVRALQPCFYDNRYRQRGEVFDFEGRIPKDSRDVLAPASEPFDPDADPNSLPNAPKRKGHARAPTWTAEGHPDAVNGPAQEDDES